MEPPSLNPRQPRQSVDYYLQSMDPDILASFSPDQLQAIQSTLAAAIPRPSPKLVDLRLGVDLLFSRFYIVLLVGKDRRKQRRQYMPERISRLGNAIAAVSLLVSLNLLISLIILLFTYLSKSALGIDLFPQEHLKDQLQKF